jgi:glutathione synthase/RimK-type ligase-like ATP-grasp enzyme
VIVFATCAHQPFLTADDQLLADALAALGYPVEPEPWTDIDPDTHLTSDPVVLRSTWDYHRVPTMFTAWLEAMADSRRTLLNPADVARANIDKSYLQSLAAAGIAVPKTRWIAHPDAAAIAAVLREERWDHAVLKPRIGATAHGTCLIFSDSLLATRSSGQTARVSEGWPSEDDLAPARASGALLQEFLPEIRDRGEVSMVYAGGAFSHAVTRRAKAGDFRVQQDFGGTVESLTPSPGLLAFGDTVMAHVSASCAYARVDLVDSARGPLLMELELIEPELYFRVVPGSAERMARVIVDRLAAR